MFKTLRKSTCHLRQKLHAQTTLEFCFCFVALLLLIYGSLMVFRWAGVSFIERRIGHDESLTAGIDESYSDYMQGPLKQLQPDFYKPSGMNFVYDQW